MLTFVGYLIVSLALPNSSQNNSWISYKIAALRPVLTWTPLLHVNMDEQDDGLLAQAMTSVNSTSTQSEPVPPYVLKIEQRLWQK